MNVAPNLGGLLAEHAGLAKRRPARKPLGVQVVPTHPPKSVAYPGPHDPHRAIRVGSIASDHFGTRFRGQRVAKLLVTIPHAIAKLHHAAVDAVDRAARGRVRAGFAGFQARRFRR